MISFHFQAGTKEAVRKMRSIGHELSNKQITKATSRAINRTLTQARTIARTEVKKVYTIAQRALPNRIDIDRSTTFHKVGKVLHDTYLTGAVTASTKPVPMEMFKVQFNPSATSKATITKKGKQVVKNLKRASKKYGGGVTIEAVRGNKEVIPFAFMLPNSKVKIYARGKYRIGSGSYGFVRRRKRLENSRGNDSVKPMLSVTVHAAAINKKVQMQMGIKVSDVYMKNLEHELEVIANGIVK